jgi:sterol-4alpha-carboxylate 3-dehydrogenase (decarboxylating)
MTGFYQVYDRGQTHFQVGNNTNLFDWTYVGNVALAHLLAADKLDTPAPAPPLNALDNMPQTMDGIPPLTKEEISLINYSLIPISLTTGKHRVPTCEARPLGPYLTVPLNGEQIKANFEGVAITSRPVVRSRFDQLSDYGLNHSKVQNPEVNPLQVAGQVFFITNGEPAYFWDFPRMIWNELDKYFPGRRKPRGTTKLSKSIGLAAATGSEWFGRITGRDVTFTRFKVTFSCATRYHNIEKARRILGYEPVVGLEEGIKRTVEVGRSSEFWIAC